MGSPFSTPLQPLATTHPLCVTVFCLFWTFPVYGPTRTLGGLRDWLLSLSITFSESVPAEAVPVLCSCSCLNDTSAWMDHIFFIQLVDLWVGPTFGAVMNNNSAISSWTSRGRAAWYRLRRSRAEAPWDRARLGGGLSRPCSAGGLASVPRLQGVSPFCRRCVTEGPCLCWSLGRQPPAHQETWWPCWARTAPVSG